MADPLVPKPASLQPQDILAAAAQGRVSNVLSVAPLASKPYQIVTGGEFFNAANTTVQQAQAQALATLSTANSTGSIYGVNRKPWVFATFKDLTTNQPTAASFSGKTLGGSSIVWVTNPKSVTWSANQRASETKNKSGTVMHVWRDRTRGTDFDDPKLTFEFQSGNIMPQSADATKIGTSMVPDPQSPSQISGGLNNFYQFLRLIDQQKIAPNGQANLIHILYSSYIFPSLVISGFFDPQAVLSFSDDSNNPFQITGWRAGFTVYQTTPKITDFASLVGQWNSELKPPTGPFLPLGGSVNLG